MSILQSYLRRSKHKWNHKIEIWCYETWVAKTVKVHGSPKIHKNYSNISKFRPIFDITGTIHCLVSKYLAYLWWPFTNEFSLKDSLDAANMNLIQFIYRACMITGSGSCNFMVKTFTENFSTATLIHYSTSDINTRCNFIDIKSVWLIIG